MTDFNVLDETWAPYGLLKVLRAGNGYEWRVFGQHNYERPLFTGTAGSFFEAQLAGEVKLHKDLKNIFWILNELSQKERREGEPVDSQMIENAIRSLNVGDKARAVGFLDHIIKREKEEGEPGDVRKLEEARMMILAEKGITKFPSEPAQAGAPQPEETGEDEQGEGKQFY
jgi:hypothetical protein